MRAKLHVANLITSVKILTELQKGHTKFKKAKSVKTPQFIEGVQLVYKGVSKLAINMCKSIAIFLTLEISDFPPL